MNREWVGMNIRRHRKRLHMTQTELGKAVGTSQPNVAHVEAGKDLIGENRIMRYARALGVSLEDLLHARPTGATRRKMIDAIYRMMPPEMKDVFPPEVVDVMPRTDLVVLHNTLLRHRAHAELERMRIEALHKERDDADEAAPKSYPLPR